MKEEAFISKNQDAWDRLAAYNRRLSLKKTCKLKLHELREFTELNRAVCHCLAYARTHYPGGETVAVLNALAGESHNNFYTRDRIRFSYVLDYIHEAFPRGVREEWRFFCVSSALFLLGAVFIFLMCGLEPSLSAFFIEGEISAGGITDGNWVFPVLSSFIITNNIRVAAMAFASGFLAGIGTVCILLINGGVIGAYVYAAAESGLDMAAFWSLILPHGIVELAAIFISGAAGLIIGKSVLVPGRYRRRDALVIACRRAAFFLPGIALMLILAGLIEGFFTPLDIAYGWKFIFAGLTFILLLCYFKFSGRNKSSDNG